MNIEEIHDYLEGKLSEGEKELFEDRMNRDANFRQEVMLQSKMIEHAGESQEINDSLDVLGDIHKKYSKKLESTEQDIVPPDIVKKTRWKVIGLVMLGILGLLYLISTQINKKPPTPPVLYAEYFNPPPASFSTKGSSALENLQSAEKAYNSEDYKTALGLFGSYAKSGEPQNHEVRFYIGLSQMALEDFEDAKSTFNDLKVENNLFAKDCDWYLSLIYLKEGDIEGAISILETFTSGTYKARSEEILSHL